MSSELQTLIGVSAFLFALLGIVVLAIFRFRSAAKRMGQSADLDSSESAFVAAAMADAVTRIRTKEQAQQARADESERLERRHRLGPDVGLDGGDGRWRRLHRESSGAQVAESAQRRWRPRACRPRHGGSAAIGTRGHDADAELRGSADQRAAAGRGDRGDAAHASADHAPRDRSEGARPAHGRRAAWRHRLADRASSTGGFRA